MRLQLATLIAAGLVGVSASAHAQGQTTMLALQPAEPGTPAPATPAPPPPPAAPAAPMAPADPAAAAPVDPAAAPAAAPAPEAPPPPQTMPLPTSGDGLEVINVLNTICQPAVAGGNIDTIAKANGFKKTKNGWVRLLGAKPYTVTLDFYSTANPNVCVVTLDFATGGAQPIVDGLNAWAYNHEPFMKLYRNDEYKTDIIRRTISWEHVGDGGASTGLVFVGEKKADGTPLSKVGDRATLRFQIRNGG